MNLTRIYKQARSLGTKTFGLVISLASQTICSSQHKISYANFEKKDKDFEPIRNVQEKQYNLHNLTVFIKYHQKKSDPPG